jgi:hypothetical protein
MRRLALLVPFVLACSGSKSSLDAAAAQSQFVSAMAGVGVNCLHREPPPFHACDGLDAGAACSVPDDDRDGGEAGFCKSLHDGRLVCAEADDDDQADGGDGEHHDGGDNDHADGGVDGGEHHGDDHSMPPGFWKRDGGLPPPFQAAVDACVSHAADDVCTVNFHEHTLQGACRLAPDGTTLICAPLCPHR